MRTQTVEGLRAGEYHGTKRLKLVSCGLSRLPAEVFDLADSLEVLDLSGNPLSSLPNHFPQLCNLKTLFLSNCCFTVFPRQLAHCRSLEMIAFRNNSMTTIPEHVFPHRLRWLILTKNQIESLPSSIGQCSRLEKVMLAGNRLESLPYQMSNCRNLCLLRLSRNIITTLPAWLFAMPQLAFLSWAGNPCAPDFQNTEKLRQIHWRDLSIGEVIGEGASGIISKATWISQNNTAVAVKIFKGEITSDGSSDDEYTACIAAGAHPQLIDPIGEITKHPERDAGLVFQLIPPKYVNLGLPPTMESCTRDTFVSGTDFKLEKCINILVAIASAAAHLHRRKVSHGDLYAHNIMVDAVGNAILGDFGAATIYANNDQPIDGRFDIERLEVLAFGHLIDDVMGLIPFDWIDEPELEKLRVLQSWCSRPVVMERPLFQDICQWLERFVKL